MEPETIVSFDINLTNGPSGSTASVKSAVGGKDFKGNEIGGQLTFTDLGESLALTEPTLNSLISNFLVTEKKVIKDKGSKFFEYSLQDKTSLILDSHLILIRGKDVAPNGAAEYEAWIANWTELPENRKRKGQAAANPSFGTQPAVKVNNCLILGQIYNEISSTDDNGDPFTKVFQNGAYKTEFSQNPQGPITDEVDDEGAVIPLGDVKWEDSKQKFGYTSEELQEALDLINIEISGIEPNSDFLNEESGSASSAISSLAAKLGLYVRINGFDNKVIAFSPAEASDYVVEDLTLSTDDCILSATYQENKLIPTKAVSYNSLIKSESITVIQTSYGGGAGRTLKKPFYLVKEAYGKGDSAIGRMAGMLFVLHDRKALNDETMFNWLTWLWLKKPAGDTGMNLFKNGNLIPAGSGLELDPKDKTDQRAGLPNSIKNTLDKVKGVAPKVYSMLQSDGKVREGGYGNAVFSGLINFILERAMNGIYVTDGMTEYRAFRTQISGEGMDIVKSPVGTDPIIGSTDLKDIEMLAPLASFFNALTSGEYGQAIPKTVHDLYQLTGRNKGRKSEYYFVGLKPYKGSLWQTPQKVVLDVVGIGNIDFANLNGESMVVKNEDQLESFYTFTINKFKEAGGIDKQPFISMNYVKSKKPIGVDEDEDTDVFGAGGGGGGGTTIEDISTNRDYKSYSLDSAVSNDFHPHSFVLNEGSIDEMDALKSNATINSLVAKSTYSSSATYLSLFLPDFTDPTLNSVSYDFGSDGVKTTVSYSTKQLLPMDEKIIKDRFNIVSLSRPVFSRDSASRKNALRV